VDVIPGTGFQIPAGSLTTRATVANVALPQGNYAFTGYVDLKPTQLPPQQYTCALKDIGDAITLDVSPTILGTTVRITLSGLVAPPFATQLQLSCGSDSPALLIKAHLNLIQVDHLLPAITVTAGN
jgi:hypothetical protein